jgi:uncharacterized protein YbjT (DUF2867 family)
MFVVAGVTGNTGSVVADALLRAGAPVRVVLRDRERAAEWTARGAEAALADLADVAALAAALRGAAAAYLLVPPNLQVDDPIADAARVAGAIAAAVDRAQLPHAVILSAFGAHQADAPGMLATTRLFEQRMLQIAGRLTILRAASFFETSAPMMLLGASTGEMPSLVALERSFEQIAAADFGRMAAEAMLAPGTEHRRVIELSGPRAYSANEMAAAVAALAGRPVRATLVPPEQRVPALTAIGMGPRYASLVVDICDALSAGRTSFEGPDLRRGSVTLEECLGRMLAAPGAAAAPRR